MGHSISPAKVYAGDNWSAIPWAFFVAPSRGGDAPNAGSQLFEGRAPQTSAAAACKLLLSAEPTVCLSLMDAIRSTTTDL